MNRLLLLAFALASTLATGSQRERVFARGEFERWSGAGPPIGPPVKVAVWSPSLLVLIDAEGRAALMPASGPPSPLPFSAPVAEVVVAVNLWGWTCARTRDDSLECLTNVQSGSGSGDRIRFPALRHKVRRLSPFNDGDGLCVAASAAKGTCATFRSQQFVERDRHLLVNPVPEVAADPRKVFAVATDPARLGVSVADSTAWCLLTEQGGVRCEGSALYGQLGNGSHTPARTTSVVDLPKVVELVGGDRLFCARLEDGRVACWGVLPEDLPVEHPRTEYPHCRYDVEATNRNWEAAKVQAREHFEACVKRPCGGLDCALGCSQDARKVPVFDRSTLCSEPWFSGSSLDPGYPFAENLRTDVHVWFSDQPLFLEGLRARSLSVAGSTVCLVSQAEEQQSSLQQQLVCFGRGG